MGVTCSEEEELMNVQYAVRSETGLKRSKNEDSYRIELRDGHNWGIGNSTLLMAVADGMGGHPCGGCKYDGLRGSDRYPRYN
jgi:serine/threonine protein phosphatase PrpC